MTFCRLHTAVLIVGGLVLSCGDFLPEDGSPSQSGPSLEENEAYKSAQSEIEFLGTESGNPTNSEMETGTESGNPTHTPPEEVEPEVSDIEPETDFDGPDVPGIPDDDDVTGQVEPEVDVGGGHDGVPDDGNEQASGGFDGSDAEVPSSGGAGGSTSNAGAPTSGVGDSGGSGGAGAAQSGCEPVACQATAEGALSWLAQTLDVPNVSEPVCTSERACECQGSPDAAANAPRLLPNAPCHVTDKLGQCLYSDADFSGCEPAEPAACDGPCQDAHAAATQAAAPMGATVSWSQCTAVGSCEYLLLLDGDLGCALGTDGTSLRVAACDE